MTPTEKIEQAFLQLSFAIKLLTYIELKKIDQSDFDGETTILLKRRNINLPANTFKTYDDLMFAAENTFNITLGATSIIMDESLTSCGIKNSYADQTPRGQIRSLIYMIRCAFAHNMVQPTWNVYPKYRKLIEFTALEENIRIDLAELNGYPFQMDHIGGHDVYWELKNKVLEMIST
jgi:hypothetical protein